MSKEYGGYKKGGTVSKAVYKNGEEEKVSDVLTYPCHAIPERGITKEAAEHFGIRTKYNEENGQAAAHYFPYTFDGKIVGFKKRDLTVPKIHKYHFTTVGTQGPKCDLFGTNVGNKTGGKKVFIVEGEYDCAVLWSVLKEKHRQGNPTVLSISSGTASAVLNIGQKQNQTYLGRFAEVVLAFDNDRATPEEREKEKIMKGQDAVAAVYGLMPHIFVADFPDEYDPCDMVREGMSEQLYWACMKPKTFTPDGFVKFEQFQEKAKELPTLGKPWPWPTMSKLSLGRRLGEGHYIGAGVKIGKSEFVNKLTEMVVFEEKNKIALFKFEEEPEITCKKVAGKMYKKDFTNPERIIFIAEDGSEVDIYGNPILHKEYGFYTQEELAQAVDAVGDNVIYYNNYGACSWDAVKGAIRHAVLVEGVQDIVLDPISRMVQGLPAAEANTALEKFADEISKMSKDLGFTYYCFCHLKAPESGPGHERGGKVLSHQFTGSRAMMRSCYYMWGIERDKNPDLPEKVRNTSTFVLLEDRKYGRSGYFKVYYDPNTGDYVEPPKGFLDSSVENLADWKPEMEIKDY
ncbi:hypothetical protein D3C85_474700 [compost metagenome]